MSEKILFDVYKSVCDMRDVMGSTPDYDPNKTRSNRLIENSRLECYNNPHTN